jgi:hypothetical protein
MGVAHHEESGSGISKLVASDEVCKEDHAVLVLGLGDCIVALRYKVIRKVQVLLLADFVDCFYGGG